MGGAARWGGRWLSWFVWAYATLIGLWLVARALAGDGPWWLALLNTDALVLFLPLVPLLPLALWRRQPRLLLALALPVAAFAGLFGEVLLPPAPAPAPAGPTVTAMTFNVLWSNEDYGRLVAAIRAADADLVALQELRPGHLAALEAELGAAYPHRALHPTDPSLGLLSRLPIESAVPLTEPVPTRALLVRVRAGDRPLAVVTAHLTPTIALDRGLPRLPATVTERYAVRAAEAEALLTAARTAGRPTLILCDCNLTDTSAAYDLLRAGLVDSFAEAGWGLRRTMLAPILSWPAQRLDYIWHSGELRAVAASVGRDGGSDHLPAVARLAWRTGEHP